MVDIVHFSKNPVESVPNTIVVGRKSRNIELLRILDEFSGYSLPNFIRPP